MAREMTRIPCSVETRENVLKPLKGDDETYDDLLERMSRAVEGGTSEGVDAPDFRRGGASGGPEVVADDLVNRLETALQHQTDDIISQTSRQTAEEVTSRLR